MTNPRVGDTVHYIATDTPGQHPGPRCAAAIVTDMLDDGPTLVVLHPAGYQFMQDPAPFDAGSEVEEPTDLCGGLGYAPGSWHPLPAQARAKRKATTK